jgi:hypothetical protein
MRKLIYGMGTSLDGYIETRTGEIAMPAPDEELHRFANDQARDMAGPARPADRRGGNCFWRLV